MNSRSRSGEATKGAPMSDGYCSLCFEAHWDLFEIASSELVAGLEMWKGTERIQDSLVLASSHKISSNLDSNALGTLIHAMRACSSAKSQTRAFYIIQRGDDDVSILPLNACLNHRYKLVGGSIQIYLALRLRTLASCIREEAGESERTGHMAQNIFVAAISTRSINSCLTSLRTIWCWQESRPHEPSKRREGLRCRFTANPMPRREF